ncbi:hemocin immunity protein [Rodentibacter genomosp. 2]|nr:hemocin immunity protein [Rodentibacter genomosp. 2]
MGVLGPHEGRELELMLNHQKDLALFYTDYEIPEDFYPYLENKTFQLKTINLKRRALGYIAYYLIYRPEHIKKAEALISVLKSYDKFDPDLERKIGKLLGYSNDDIEFYINHWLKST